jgi:hypothetical protein
MIHHQDRGKRARDIGTQIGHGANPRSGQKFLILRAACGNKRFINLA